MPSYDIKISGSYFNTKMSIFQLGNSLYHAEIVLQPSKNHFNIKILSFSIGFPIKKVRDSHLS